MLCRATAGPGEPHELAMIRILIGGDICPMGSVEQAFAAGSAPDLFHDLLGEIAAAEISVANLECPLISNPTPIVKAAPVLGAGHQCVRGLAAAGWKVLNLANNHSFDHGTPGLQETMHTVRAAGISVVGAGLNLAEAHAPFVTEVDGQRIVLYAMAEREFSLAEGETAGANPLDLIQFVQAVQTYKQGGIFLVLVHGGKEHYPYPSPEMVRRSRFLVDMGADAVVCCHAHCPLPWEVYRDRPIVYGLGNLIFEPLRRPPAGWHDGYLARLSVAGGKVGLEVIPYHQSRPDPGARLMDADARQSFLSGMEERNRCLQDPAGLEERWRCYCQDLREEYLTVLFGYNKLMQRFRRPLLRKLHSRAEVLGALLLVQCETHQEVLNTIFRKERLSHDP
jgi:hypothetical protein